MTVSVINKPFVYEKFVFFFYKDQNFYWDSFNDKDELFFNIKISTWRVHGTASSLRACII